jgi:transcriptional regulator
MYLPKHFEETRVEVLHQLIRERAFAALVTFGPDGLNANHIPFEIDPGPAPLGTLRGHVARANPVWKQAGTDAEALVIFQGPHSYITPSWYATKQETAKVVPTWNYAMVHAYGPMRAVEDAAWLRALLTKLTNHHESLRSEPWKLTDAPDEFIERQMQAIVGIEIPLTRLIGKWKVSQNRPAADRDGVIAGLTQNGDAVSQAMAELVRQYKDAG